MACSALLTGGEDERAERQALVFRFDGGLIAELWYIGKPMPEGSPNEAGMF